MEIKLCCPQCATQYSTDLKIILDSMNYKQEFNDDSIYEFTCVNGHKNSFRVDNPKYELIFDMGILAYSSGFYTEACLDFAASLERFREYCIYTMFFQDGSIAYDKVKALWKRMSHRSEIQYGAFSALYTFILGELPSEPSRGMIEFRNKVVHKGYFPGKDETRDYCIKVYKNINEVRKQISQKIDFSRGRFPAIIDAMKNNKGQGCCCLATFLSYVYENDSFDDAYNNFMKMAPLTYSV